jgi:predicted XRE-type DNA-binding protein
MYEVSGQEKISLHSFYRYQRDKEQDEAIKQQIGTGILALLNRKNLSQDEIENLIKR